MKKYHTLTFILFLILFFACEKNDKPVNLTIARNEVKQYYESGKYDEELIQVIEEAKKPK